MTAPPPAPQVAFKDGTFRVNTDIQPGTYQTTGGSSCYWERLKGFSGQLKAKPKITDKWDYFDVKGVVPENVADLDKVFGAGGERLPYDLTPPCSTSFFRRWPPGWCSVASTC